MLKLTEALESAPVTYAGDSASVSFQLERDGVSVDASATPVGTVTDPEGVVIAHTVTAIDGLGAYSVGFTPATAGQYRIRLAATQLGQIAVTVTVLTVTEPQLVVSLADVRRHLRIEHTDADDQLTSVMRVAVAQCEDVTGKAWYRRQVTSLVGPVSVSRSLFVLPLAPVLSVQSVSIDGSALSGWTFDSEGGLLQLDSAPSFDSTRIDPVSVTYTVGPVNGVVPANIQQGILEVISLYWARQRGGSNLPMQNDMGPSPWALPLTVTNSYRTGLWDTIRLSSF